MKNNVKLLVIACAVGLLLTGCKKKEQTDGGTDVQTQIEQESAMKAPDFTLQNYDGSEVSLSDYEGKIVVLDWFNYECPFSRYSYETAGILRQLKDKYADKGVVFLAINSTAHADPEKTKQVAQASNLDYPILDDSSGTVGRAYGAKTTPHVFIIDKQGNIAYSGAIDNAPMGNATEEKINYTEQALKELLAGKEVSTPKTDPYGCSVKYAQ